MLKLRVNKIGITFFVISSIASLFLLEIGLRLAGLTFSISRENNFKIETENYDSERDYESFELTQKNSKLIWTIGDSFTNAGNVSSLESYPAYLFATLENNSFHYNIVNLGQCEDPTWGTYDRLKNLLSNSKNYPDLVIFLVGVSDPFYYLFSQTIPPTRQEQKLVKFEIEKSWYESLRVYKVYRHLKLTLINKNISKNGNELSEGDMETLNALYNKIKLEIRTDSINWNFMEEKIKNLLENHRGLLDGDINEFKFKDKIRLVSNTLVTPMVRGFTSRLKYNDALEVYLNFLKDYPEYFWNDERNSINSLHTISQILMFQSKYSGRELLQILENSKEINLKHRKSKLYQQAKKIFQDRGKVEKIIDQKRILVWEKISELQKKYGFKVIIQTYPSEFNSINSFLKTLANDEGYTLVDNYELFKIHIKKYGRDKIFADDNHFLPLGYKLMANEIFLKLKEKEIIK